MASKMIVISFSAEVAACPSLSYDGQARLGWAGLGKGWGWIAKDSEYLLLSLGVQA